MPGPARTLAVGSTVAGAAASPVDSAKTALTPSNSLVTIVSAPSHTNATRPIFKAIAPRHGDFLVACLPSRLDEGFCPAINLRAISDTEAHNELSLAGCKDEQH